MRAFFISAILSLLLFTVYVLGLIQEASGGESQVTFWGIICFGDFISKLIWIVISISIILLLPISCTSIIKCSNIQSKQVPLVTKLMLIIALLIFCLAFIGAIEHIVRIQALPLQPNDCYDNSMIVACQLSGALYIASLAIMSSLAYILSFGISLTILHKKQKKFYQSEMVQPSNTVQVEFNNEIGSDIL